MNDENLRAVISDVVFVGKGPNIIDVCLILKGFQRSDDKTINKFVELKGQYVEIRIAR